MICLHTEAESEGKAKADDTSKAKAKAKAKYGAAPEANVKATAEARIKTMDNRLSI